MRSVILFKDYELFENGTWYSHKSNCWLKQYKNSNGYYRVWLWHSGIRKHCFTHIKVVEFFGNCKGEHIPPNHKTLHELGLSIDHLDGNKENNARENLELVTHKENVIRFWQRRHSEIVEDLPF